MASKALFSIIPRVKRKEEKEEKEERKRSFLKNGSMLLEDLIASCDGKSHPIRCYSATEIIRATNNFDRSCIIDELVQFNMYRAILDHRTVIIKKYRHRVDKAIRDIIISMQMSTRKNSLKLLGCCLEFEMPALVFENAGKGGLNFDGSLVADNELLPWKTRLRIAKQLASALTFLHTAFPRPIIHRCVSSCCVLLDDDYVPKLFDFSLSITIPPDQLYVEDFPRGTVGYMDPTYQTQYICSEKTDVYSFGVVLLVFLMRRKARIVREYLTRDPKLNVSDGQIQIETIADPKILGEVGGDEQAQQQLQDFLALALLCIQEKTEARPDMIDVAKELMSSHKNALKLLGCCLEFPLPALVHENAAKGVLRDDGSLSVANGGQSLLPWKTRLHIAKQLANALTYLHTTFSRPIFHRNLRSTCILLDDDYVPKLSNFSFSIRDQSHVKGDNKIRASGYTDPDYLVLLTRRDAYSNQAGGLDITANPKFHVSDGQTQIQTIVDPKILQEVGADGHAQQQLQDFLALALSCIQNQTEERPKMIDVAKELVRIEKSIFP
ncbi:unnamed protein product [Prunus armeniaca]